MIPPGVDLGRAEYVNMWLGVHLALGLQLAMTLSLAICHDSLLHI